MNILLVSGRGEFSENFITKLVKDKHTVFMLTGSEQTRPKPRGVFEQFRFRYDTEVINEILLSSNPDAVVFCGAADPVYSWDNEDISRTSTELMAGLVNILMSCVAANVPHFIFVSSDDVFGGYSPEPITENTEPVTDTTRGFTLRQAESLAMSCGQNSETDVTIVRLDNLFCIPEDSRHGTNPASLACTSYLVNEETEGSGTKCFSYVFSQDAVEVLYEITVAKKCRHNVYHISSGEKISSLTLAEAVNKVAKKHFKLTDRTIGEERLHMLSNERVREEFGFTPRVGLAAGLKPIYAEIEHHLNKYIPDIDKEKIRERERLKKSFKTLVKRSLPYIEALIVLLFILYISSTKLADQYLGKLDFYLLYVLLFSVIYGKQQSIFTGIASVVGYFFFSHGDTSVYDIAIDFNTYVWIAQLFIVGMTVGHICDNIRFITEDKDDEIRYITHNLDDMKRINKSAMSIKSNLEKRLISYDNSLGSLYKTTSELDVSIREEILFKATKLISSEIETRDVAIYRVVDDNHCRLFSSTSKQARALGKWVSYSEMGEVAEALVARVVYINKEITPSLPLMVSGIYVEGQLDAIVMLWGLPLERMTLFQANALTVLCGVISGAIRRGSLYNDAIRDRRYLSTTEILSSDAFMSLVSIHREAMENELAEFALLRIIRDGRTDDEYSAAISPLIRAYDNIGYDNDGNLSVLLTNTGHGEAEIVKNRFGESGIDAEVMT